MAYASDLFINQLDLVTSAAEGDFLVFWENTGSPNKTERITRANFLKVQDNLTSTSTVDPLSANQGRLLDLNKVDVATINSFGTGTKVITNSDGLVTDVLDHDYSTDGVGVLPIDHGGTNSSTALVNDRVMISSSGAIVESPLISTAELNLLDGFVSVSTGTTDNDKLVTQGFVDDSVHWDRDAANNVVHTKVTADNVGIGTGAGVLTEKLVVTSAANTFGRMQATDPDSDAGWIYENDAETWTQLVDGSNSDEFAIKDTTDTHLTIAAGAKGDITAQTGDIILPNDDRAVIVGATNDGEYYASAGDVYLENTNEDNDIVFQINQSGALNTEVMRVAGNEAAVGIGGVVTPETKLHVIKDERLAVTAGTNSNFTHHEVTDLTNFTAFSNAVIMSVSNTAGTSLRGIARVFVGGSTATQGNGALTAEWFFDINNANPTVGLISESKTEAVTGSAPQFRLNVTGTDIEFQVASSDGVNNFNGLLDIQVFAPKATGTATSFAFT